MENELNQEPNHHPAISVLVLAWNHADYLDDLFSSLETQTFQDFELIFLDNCSTDGTYLEALARSKKLTGNHTLILQNDAPATIPVNLNRMLGHARAEVVCLISADDWMAPTNLEEKYAALVSDSQAGVAYSSGWVFQHETGKCTPMTVRPIPRGDHFRHLMLRNYVVVIGCCIRRSALLAVGGFDESSGVEDWTLWLKLAQAGYSFVYIRKQLVYYRRHKSNFSSLASEKYFIEKVKMFDRYRDHPLYTKAIKKLDHGHPLLWAPPTLATLKKTLQFSWRHPHRWRLIVLNLARFVLQRK